MFAEFWAVYPKKAGKVTAEAAWLKLNPSKALHSKILAAIETAKKSRQWQRDGGQYIPHPATWLNQRRWEDEAAMTPANRDFPACRKVQQASTSSYGKYDEAETILRRIRAQEAEKKATEMRCEDSS